jgi:hypothetical protein
MRSRKNAKLIRLVEIGLTSIKNLMHIIAAFVGITIAITVHDFVTDNVEWGIIDSAFGIGSIVFLARIRQTRQRHYSSRAEY